MKKPFKPYLAVVTWEDACFYGTSIVENVEEAVGSHIPFLVELAGWVFLHDEKILKISPWRTPPRGQNVEEFRSHHVIPIGMIRKIERIS